MRLLPTHRLLLLSSTLTVLPALVSCGSRSQLFGTNSSGGSAGSGAAGPGGSPASSTMGGGGAGPTTTTSMGGTGATGATGGTGGCPLSCSADLHDVLDCQGKVVAECPPEQGCANGQCIDDGCLAAKLSESSYGCE